MAAPPPDLPKLVALYDALYREAKGDTFTGSVVQAYHSTQLPGSYYSRLFHYLTEMGCIEQVQRGTRGRPSIIRLVKTPTEEDFLSVYKPGKFTQKSLTNLKSHATLQEEVEMLTRRLPNIDLEQWIVSTEARIAELEAKLKGE